MATYTHEITTTRTHRIVLPVAPDGIPLGDLTETIRDATMSARQAWGLDEATVLPPDALNAKLTAGAIVITYVVQETQQ